MEKITIIYEDTDVLVLDKPAGWVTTKENRKEKDKYIEDWVGQYFPNNLPRKGIVHRLDKGTSGILVVAKNNEALRKLKKDFKERRVVKKYLALVSGDFPFKAEVRMPIKRAHYQFDKFGVSEDGKMAVTEFKRVKRYKRNGKIYSLVEANLKTGRTHQIRVHLSYLKWPIVGDKLYRGESLLDRPFLQAYHTEIKQPKTDSVLELEVPLAPELQNHLQQYEEI